MTDTHDTAIRPLKRKVTADKTPLDTDTAARVKAIQRAIGRARDRIDAWRKGAKKESNHTIAFVESIGFSIFGKLADGSEIALRFVNGIRHPDTGLNHFVIVSRETAGAWPASPYKEHKWFARQATTGDYEVRLQHPPASSLNKSVNAARAVYELAHPEAFGTPGHRVVVKDQGGLRNGLDLRLSNLKMESPAEYRSQKKGTKPPSLDDLRREIASLIGGDGER